MNTTAGSRILALGLAAFALVLPFPTGTLAAQENAEDAAIPAVGGRVQSIRFFDAVPPLPLRADRPYSARFDANRARFIYTEVEVRHEPTGREGVEFVVECTYFRPDGSEVGTTPLTFRPQPEWTGVAAVNALGNARSGSWRTGFYRVICAHEGNPVVETGFDVFEGEPEIPVVDGHFSSLRTFEWGEEAPAAADRDYTWRFEAATARRVTLEIGLRFAPPGRLVMIPVTCRVIRPDGSVLVERELSLRVEPEWPSILGSVTMGEAEPGSWEVGRYSASCHHGERQLGDARFDMG